MPKNRRAANVFRALFILLLILTILSTAVYSIVALSIQKGKNSDAPPELFGYQYVPYTQEGMFESIPTGSIILFQPAYPDDITAGTVVLYYTPSVSKTNEIYEDFSASTVQTIEQQEDGSIVYYVKSGALDEVEAISANIVISKGVYKLDNLAGFFLFINSTAGLVCMVAIPWVLTVLFFVLFLIFKPKRIDEDEEDEYEYYDEDEEDDERQEMEARQMISEPQIKSETVSTATEEIYQETTKDEDKEVHVSTQAEDEDSVDYTSGYLDQDDDDSTPMEEEIPEVGSSELNVAEMGALAASRLAVKTEPEEETIDDHTMEFDLEKLQEELRKEAFGVGEGMDILADLDQQLAEIQEPEDSVMFILRDQSIDVNFRNIISADIEIKNHADGSGFTIITPNYNAKITIDITNK
jgi:hypothetical protein